MAKWLQICDPCPKSPTGRHEFYVPISGMGRLRAHYNLWFDRLGKEGRSAHRKTCNICKERKNVKIIKIVGDR